VPIGKQFLFVQCPIANIVEMKTLCRSWPIPRPHARLHILARSGAFGGPVDDDERTAGVHGVDDSAPAIF